jgi:hypothetical protein
MRLVWVLVDAVTGPRGKICLRCASVEGVVLGDCNACSASGPIWEVCEYCQVLGVGYADNWAGGMHVAVNFGKCEACEEYLGPVGSRCDYCGQGNFMLAEQRDIERVAQRRLRSDRQLRPDGYTGANPNVPVRYTDRFKTGIHPSHFASGDRNEMGGESFSDSE